MSIRMRHTKGHTGNRRSHHALEKITVVKDAESGNLRLPHRLDETTGIYRGRQIFTPKTTEKKAKKAHGTHHEKVKKEGPAEKGSKGIMGKLTGAAKPKARSGFGGGA